MFNLRNALLQLNDRKFTFVAFRRELEKIHSANLGDLLPEIGTKELFLIAQHYKWVHVDNQGMVEILILTDVTRKAA